MYEIIDQGFGILLVDNQEAQPPENLRPLVADILQFIATKRKREIEPEDFDHLHVQVVELAEVNEPWMFALNNGGGVEATGIGFTFAEWPSWEVRDMPGKPGIISAARHVHTEAELAPLRKKWDALVAPIRDILDKHGATPTIFWTSSTS